MAYPTFEENISPLFAPSIIRNMNLLTYNTYYFKKCLFIDNRKFLNFTKS